MTEDSNKFFHGDEPVEIETSEDRSASYEVDVWYLGRTPSGKWIVVNESGCSCWNGEYETWEFQSEFDARKYYDNGRE